MKKIILFICLISIIPFTFYQCRSGITKLDDTSLIVKSGCNFLLLPAEDTGKEIKISVQTGDGTQVENFIFRPAKERIDYWVPIDISQKKNQKIIYTFAEPLRNDLFWKNIRLSDQKDDLVPDNYRPIYHFTPQRGWMNDPNGMVYYDGEYHLFYQHNPYATRWQNMSWGHAVSPDLIHWQHMPVALVPDSLGTIFSGSIVVDEQNTTGLQSGKEKTLLAYFTHNQRKRQMQSLAYSCDKGRTWTKYKYNPVLRNEKERDFRDPKVLWYAPDNKWVMVVAVKNKIEIYSSKNGLSWVYESNFGETYGAHGGVWECPDLLELPIENGSGRKKWVLICNVNPGGPSGGSGTQYFIGSFDGARFVCEDSPTVIKWLDWGKDHYAAVTWSNVPSNKCISVAWMSNWEYANDLPTKEHRNAMSIPREVKLYKGEDGYRLSSLPVTQLSVLAKNKRKVGSFAVKESFGIDNLIDHNRGAYEIGMTIESGSAEIVGFRLFNSKGESVHICLNEVENTLSLDRRNSGKIDFNEKFAHVSVAPIQSKKSYRLRLLVDKTSIECFEDNGKISLTNLVFPSEPYNRINFYCKGGEYNVVDFEIINY